MTRRDPPFSGHHYSPCREGPPSMSSTTAAAPSNRTWLPLAVVLTTQMMIVLDAAIVNIALPDMQQALHIAPANLSWVVNAYTLAFGGLLLLGARAGDLFGRRTV